jgi:hypothetical protein
MGVEGLHGEVALGVLRGSLPGCGACAGARGSRELIEGKGRELLYLPPCSPNPDPIEEAFSKADGFLRRVGARLP